ncbi:hypothetical protein DPMN_190284 [Dreissena polymorpha]|uniref:Uncharacterized protein n=1 Tax=Dreissena polymorpha TaxID=45954 RepID=A0A9D4DUD4_DREPO|nr:hypothetical protein DPMN_190284 [Dreissena polymorpha]
MGTYLADVRACGLEDGQAGGLAIWASGIIIESSPNLSDMFDDIKGDQDNNRLMYT